MYHIQKNCLGVSVGYQRAPGTSEKKKNAWYQRALRCQLRGRHFHPWAGRLRFSGEAHLGPAALTQSSSFSSGVGLQIESQLLLCCAPAVYMLADAPAVAAAVFGFEHLISYCNYTKRSFGPTSRGQGRRLCHAMPNYRPGEVNPKQQLHFCCRSPCESRDCCAAVAVPSGSELPSSLMLIQSVVHNTSPAPLFLFSFFFYLVPRYVYAGTYVPGTRATSPPKKEQKAY